MESVPKAWLIAGTPKNTPKAGIRFFGNYVNASYQSGGRFSTKLKRVYAVMYRHTPHGTPRNELHALFTTLEGANRCAKDFVTSGAIKICVLQLPIRWETETTGGFFFG